MREIKVTQRTSPAEAEWRERAEELLRECPIPRSELLRNLPLFLDRRTLSHVLFIHSIYERIVGVPGSIVELGSRWGRNLALFSALRGIYEPYNYARTVVGFDTFAGFRGVHEADGDEAIVEEGAYGVTDEYRGYLERVLSYHESESPVQHIRKFELIQGDVRETLPDYLEGRPETLVALAYFDLDLYEPTKACLEALAPHLVRGSVLVFDELCSRTFPGETVAVREILDLRKLKLERTRYDTYATVVTVEG